MFTPRSSGVLLHPTSFSSPYGIGDLGDESFAFIDWLARARQRWWQILPLNPTWPDGSPYKSPAAFAGNPLLISPDRLAGDGLVTREFLDPHRGSEQERSQPVDFERVSARKSAILAKAYQKFTEAGPNHPLAIAFGEFISRSQSWLSDYTLFMACREANGGRDWFEWDQGVNPSDRRATDEFRAQARERERYFAFEQFLFDRQWTEVRRHAASKGVGIIGDLPIYVAAESADVWGHREQFLLDDAGRPTEVAGVPPDYFSETGQLWNNPIYNWAHHEAEDYAWWMARIDRTLEQVDVARVDHFRGFEAYWSVPAGETTAIPGRWNDGPRQKLFRRLAEHLKGDPQSLPLIAEDLGLITPEVIALRKEFGLPGMRVLHFELMDSDPAHWNVEAYEADTIAYTGTHDNDTTRGWFENEILPHGERRDRLRSMVSGDSDAVVWGLIEMAWRAGSQVSVVPAQDLLSLGSEARMNTPGTAWPERPNWRWRLSPGALGADLADRLADLTERHQRIVVNPGA